MDNVQLGSVIHGDCLEVMNNIADHSIDLILCDLPYGSTELKWDVVIPFEPLWAHYKRVIKKNGAIVLTASQPFTSKLVMSNLKMFKYCWVWEKTLSTGSMHAKNKPLKSHEDVAVFSCGATIHACQTSNRMIYNPQMEIGEPYVKFRPKGSLKDGAGISKRESHIDFMAVNSGTRYPHSVIKFSNGNNGSLHPTQKPVALFEYLIRTYTNEGDTVLDNCAGSGTTGVACINTNRRYILIEKEQKYYDICVKRVSEASQNLLSYNDVESKRIPCR